MLKSDNMESGVNQERRVDSELRSTLRYSQKEAAASAVMTTTGDNFFNAFAIYLQASAMQLSILTALPQFVGAFMQVLSVSLAQFFQRKSLVVVTSGLQAFVMLGLAGLSALAWVSLPGVHWLIVLAILYHAGLNIIQPHWRAWMGTLVPSQRRGVFFAGRTRLAMAISLFVYLVGGVLLTLCERFAFTWFGFSCLFFAAGIGRGIATYYFAQMHDPDPHPHMSEIEVMRSTLHHCRLAIGDKTFRQYSLFVACMQGMVAISAPFFSMYMLEVLHFTYLELVLNSMASIVMQFATLGVWGRVSDHYGNRLVIMVTSIILPILPILWLVSDNFYYLIGVQLLSGLGWSGFNLSTANYLYDIRPHRSNFAIYAALQSSSCASLIFVGALFGGWVASNADIIAQGLPFALATPIFVVFICSTSLRTLVSLWFLPRITEPHIRVRPNMLKIVFRVARFNAISGTVLDWLTVYRKKDDRGADS